MKKITVSATFRLSYDVCLYSFLTVPIFFLDDPGMVSRVWRFFYDNYTSTDVKDHVTLSVQRGLITLEWESFNPTVPDATSMVTVMDR